MTDPTDLPTVLETAPAAQLGHKFYLPGRFYVEHGLDQMTFPAFHHAFRHPDD